MSLTAKLLLSPLLVAQALATRVRMPRLPEAAGPREGETGRGPLLRLLIVGDSSAAAGASVSSICRHCALVMPERASNCQRTRARHCAASARTR